MDFIIRDISSCLDFSAETNNILTFFPGGG